MSKLLKSKSGWENRIYIGTRSVFSCHVETIALLSRETYRPKKDYIKVGIDAEEYYAIKNASRD